jgi:hypothetical protein
MNIRERCYLKTALKNIFKELGFYESEGIPTEKILNHCMKMQKMQKFTEGEIIRFIARYFPHKYCYRVWKVNGRYERWFLNPKFPISERRSLSLNSAAIS